jgi:hypothetical protein
MTQSINFAALLQEANAASTAVLPKGDYPLTVTETDAIQSGTGKPMIKIKFVVSSGHQNQGTPVYTNLVLSEENPKALRMFFRNLAAFGITADVVSGLSNQPNGMATIASMMLGRQVFVTLGQREWPAGSNEWSNEVTAYKTLAGAGAVQAPAPAVPGMPGIQLPTPGAAPGVPGFPVPQPQSQPQMAGVPGMPGMPATPGFPQPQAPAPVQPQQMPQPQFPVPSLPPQPTAAPQMPQPSQPAPQLAQVPQPAAAPVATAPNDTPPPGFEAVWATMPPEAKAAIRAQMGGAATQATPAPQTQPAPNGAVPGMPTLPF